MTSIASAYWSSSSGTCPTGIDNNVRKSPHGAGSSRLPAGKRLPDQVRVQVARIVRDFRAHPVRPVEGLLLGRQFDFRHHQPRVHAEELVDFPCEAGVLDAAPVFLDDGLLAQAVE